MVKTVTKPKNQWTWSNHTSRSRAYFSCPTVVVLSLFKTLKLIIFCRMWGCSRCQCGRTEVPYQTPDSCTWGHEWGLSALPGRETICTRTPFSNPSPKLFSGYFPQYLRHPTTSAPPSFLPSIPRSSSILSGWLHVVWAQRVRLWLTAVSRMKLRAFAPFCLCKRAIPVPMATQLPVTKVSILTVWCHLAIIRSTRPNRYGRGKTYFSIDIILHFWKCLLE